MIAKERIQPYLQIHPDDNVLVALRDLPSGTAISFDNETLILQQDVGAKHKIFINDMKAGDEVIMYGTLVGKTQADIRRGGLMTTQNTKHAAGKYTYRGYRSNWQSLTVSKFENRTFNGYKRTHSYGFL